MMPYVHRHIRPPTQVLRGSRLVIEINADTAPGMPVIRLKRRAQRIRSCGKIGIRIEEVWYEIQTDGLVTRVDEEGERKRVPEGHAEWKWARDAQNWLWKKTFEGARAAGSPPLDLVAWEVGKPQGG